MPDLTIADLAHAAERVLTYPPDKQHALARRSAPWAIERRPGATVADVVRGQGLSEENAERAVGQLRAMGAVRLRPTGGYEVAGGVS